MNRAAFALCLGLATTPAAAQPAPGDTPPAPSSQLQAHECEPYPECVVISSPLRPGAPGIGIRDKALLDQLRGPVRQPQERGIITKPAPPPQ
jgi:hypothetical protein